MPVRVPASHTAGREGIGSPGYHRSGSHPPGPGGPPPSFPSAGIVHAARLQPADASQFRGMTDISPTVILPISANLPFDNCTVFDNSNCKPGQVAIRTKANSSGSSTSGSSFSSSSMTGGPQVRRQSVDRPCSQTVGLNPLRSLEPHDNVIQGYIRKGCGDSDYSIAIRESGAKGQQPTELVVLRAGDGFPVPLLHCAICLVSCMPSLRGPIV